VVSRKKFVDEQGYEPFMNPSKFDRCVKEVEAKGGASNAYAVCTAAGTRENAVHSFHDANRDWSYFESRDEALDYARRARDAGLTHVKVQRVPKRLRSGLPGAHVLPPIDYWMTSWKRRGSQKNVTLVPIGLTDVDQLDKAAKGIYSGLKAKRKRGNPGEIHESESVERSYELFHGRAPSETIVEEKQVYLGPSQMWSVGDLIKIKVQLPDGDTVTLENFESPNGKACHLTANRKGTQLYVRKGDQSVDLEEFEIGQPYHDKEDLGEVVMIWYFTTKTHLGDDGGEANYYHRLGEEHVLRPVEKSYEFGHIKTRRVPRPRLVYDTKNEELEFVGGEYIIEVEGIRN